MEKDYSWKPIDSPIIKESIAHPHVEKELASLFDVADGGSTEYEVLNWLHSNVRVLKANLILETGTWNGFGTMALAHACKLNGFGKVHSLEIIQSQHARIQELLKKENLSEWAEVHLVNSISFLNQSDLIFDIGFFDSEIPIRPLECEILLNNNRIKKLAVFHDTSPYRSESAPHFTKPEVQRKYREKIMELTKHPRCTGYYDSHLSRGFIALFLKD